MFGCERDEDVQLAGCEFDEDVQLVNCECDKAVQLVGCDRQGSIVYETIGVYPAQSFFQVDSASGAVFIIQDLKNDERARTLYTVRSSSLS